VGVLAAHPHIPTVMYSHVILLAQTVGPIYVHVVKILRALGHSIRGKRVV